MKKIKKLIASLIICLLLFGPIVGPLVVYAQEIEATPTPSPTPITEVIVNNEPTTVTTEADSTAISGENAIVDPTPTPNPALLLELIATPSAEPVLSTEASVSPTPNPSPDTKISTGDALSVTEVNNSINTTQVNSQVVYKTLNIFLSGDIVLADSGTLQTIVEQALTGNPDGETTVSVSFDGHNVARVSNEIISIAQSGSNSVDGGQEAVINTGNSYSVVSLLNQVNTTIINSQIYLVTINIFGDVTANIILPELTSSKNSTPCCDGQQININNQATVSSSINSQAISGQNTIAAQTEAVIETGDANSSINVINLVNTNLINTTISQLVINVLGDWIGSWIASDQWLNQSSTPPEANCDGCIGDIALSNQALVDNQITSLADSGNNNISADSGRIKTGNAYSQVSLFNLVNTNIINSTGFWGFINIFGRLTGNVGTAADLFPETSAEPTPEPEILSSSGPEIRETGGELTISQSNNVGEYILPGDTVTFDVLVKNPGGGRVYDTKLWVGLVIDGQEVGGGFINLGNIDAKKGVKVSSGLVLSNAAPGGQYQALAEVTGSVGPNNDAVKAEAWSEFLIAAFTPILEKITTPVQAEETPLVLGETIAAGVTPYQQLLKLFWIMLTILIVLRAIENREKLAYSFNKNKGFLINKAMAIRSLLFALLALIKHS